MRAYILLLLLSFFLADVVSAQDTLQKSDLAYKIMPSNIKLQFAGNIGMFSTGIGYESPNKRWKGDLLYGFVPRRYSGTEPIHSLTVKGKYSTLHREYKEDIHVEWLQMGLWVNYALNEDFFFKLPSYYEPNYYLIRPGLNIGGFLGSEVRYKNWGLYYEVGTTDKYLIHFFKNFPSVQFNHIVSSGLGLVFHLKP
ncbi:hypothetical protein FAZ15_13000 [Sphingobacterium olei]|uniref:Outer membrane protein beta-barrel domain-containing protein n=1 Tax=Sphingobacterium olei TaxID=2571155 RepID=A0A4U0NY90_9SPHI|nr:hypothetical protein [Sphingobacterium olei]TJZ59811.1 hypothetical protein FAZ15_13000 [Sphingobacterium olei]